MTDSPLSILSTGLVTSVGLSAPASCAAIRSKLTNPIQTCFIDSFGERIMAHEVPLEKPWRGLAKLTRMAVMAIEEAMTGVSRNLWGRAPLLLCIAEPERPGRTDGLDDRLFAAIERSLGVRFAPQSAVVAEGRVAAASALALARTLLDEHQFSHVLVVACDSLLNWPTLSHYDQQDRLLTAHNSNGFMPGEGAGALLVGRPTVGSHLACTGIGFGLESAHIDTDQPLRGDGLTVAIKKALADGRTEMHEMDFRIADLSGEQYYFKEATLALSRSLRQRKEEFDIWHPAECTGESGALAGVTVLALAHAACLRGFSKGQRILAHMACDSGRRAAMTLHYRTE